MVVIPIGVPGSGKGTQAELLEHELGIVHISTGDLFRYHIKNKTELGMKVQVFMDRGDLVPDEIMIKILEERLSLYDCKKGFILDGYPRDINQANALEEMLNKLDTKIDAVLYFHLNLEAMLERLRGRWSCKAADHIYHEKFSPPKVTGKCDIDGSELYQRKDQTEEAIQERIEKYNAETAPVVEHYRKKPFFKEIDASKSIQEVHEEIKTFFHIKN